MPQSAEKILDHELLFREPEYQNIFATKKANFEFNHADVRIEEIRNWTKTPEYKEKNFAREALTVNPGQGLPAAGCRVRGQRLQQDLELRARQPGLRGLLPQPLQPLTSRSRPPASVRR